MRIRHPFLLALLCAAPLAACGSSDDGSTAPEDGGVDSGGTLDSGSPTDTAPRDTGVTDAGGDGGAETSADAPVDTAPAAVRFQLRIENVSGSASLPTPISPAAWAIAKAADPFFTEGAVDRGQGLERIAEEGNASVLLGSLGGSSALSAFGVVDTPVGATKAGPALPGGAFELTFSAVPGAGKLTFAQMFGQSNDVFLGPDGAGIELFDAAGKPLPERDVTSLVALWDAGTEHNQPPTLGPDQAPRQGVANTGASEGVVDKFTSGTRAYPTGKSLVDFAVTATGSTYTIKITNVSKTKGAIVSPISPVFYAVHDSTFALFKPGITAKGDGLESLAEDGSPAALVAQHSGKSSVAKAAAVTVIDGGTSAGPAKPGDSFTLVVTPDAAHPRLSIASMVGESNDTFLALPSAGIALLDAGGAPRPVADVEAELRRSLGTWDAGTEANEVPGVGKNQGPRQGTPNTGPDDPKEGVRLYDDWTNDLVDMSKLVKVTIVQSTTTTGAFDVTIADQSGDTPFPGNVSPLAYATHDATFSLFQIGTHASAGIEHVSEDGNPTMLGAAIASASGVGSSAIVDVPEGAAGPGPLTPGKSFHFTVKPDATHRFFSFAAMWAPSNDTFIGFDPAGIALLDASGAPRANDAIAADVAAHFFGWDAGTEENQAGCLGPDQPPRQAAPDTGADEGSGKVRKLVDPVWGWPLASEIVKVTLRPLP